MAGRLVTVSPTGWYTSSLRVWSEPLMRAAFP